MGFLDRLFGTDEAAQAAPAAPPAPRRAVQSDDERAVERYRYLLQTAPPETIEQVHAEAFAKLSDEQRALIYEELSKGAGTGERPLSSEPATLARAATRAEMRNPGSLQNTLGGSGMGFGSMMGASLLGTVAGFVVGSALVSAFLPYDGGADAGAESGDGGGDNGDSGSDASGSDSNGADGGGADASADAGSDFGGGDFGGGDFGGGGGDFGF